MKPERIDDLIREALAIEAHEAKEAGALGFMARALTQATLPHSNPHGHTFERQNGLMNLTIMAPPKFGLPYGSYPRLLLSWLTTEAVRTKSPELQLGPSLSSFMAELSLLPTGGRWGTIPRLRDQMNRLFTSTISCTYTNGDFDAGKGFMLTSEFQLWWHPKNPDQATLWNSTVTLSHEFFKDVIDSPIPVDMRALKALKKSPMALDIYCWLTYRMSYLRKKTLIPWKCLQMQFGSDYAVQRQFKAAFLKHLKSVCLIYPEARVYDLPRGLILEPSRPHVAKRLVPDQPRHKLPRPKKDDPIRDMFDPIY